MKVSFTILLSIFSILLTAQNPQSFACDIHLGPDVTVCNGAVFTLNPHPDPNGNYLWTGSPGLSCYNCPSPEFTGLPTGNYTYIATLTTPDCTQRDTIRITVINGQAPVYQIAESQGICAGDSIQIGGPEAPGTFYNWMSVPAGFSSSLSDPKVKPSGTITYFLTISNVSCPLLSRDSVTITPVSLALQLNPSDTVRICQGRSRALQATTTPAGQTVTWSPSVGLQINGNTATASPLAGTLYTATASLNGCIRQKSIFVAVDSIPKNMGIHPADTTICLGQPVALVSASYNQNAYPGITFKWTPASGLGNPDNQYSPMVVQPNMTTLYRRISRNGLCIDTAYALIHVVPTAEMTIQPSDTTICPGRPVSLQVATTPGVTNIQWSPPTGLSCSNCNSPMATPSATITYTATGLYQSCPVTTTTTVQVRPLAPIKFPDDRVLCAGESVVLNEIFDPLAKYVWTSTHPGFGTVTGPNPLYTPTQTAVYRVTADNGCIRQDSVIISVIDVQLTVKGDTIICKNFKTKLTATANLPGTYQWRDNNTGQIIGSGQTIEVKPGQTTTYTVIYTSATGGCQKSADVTVTLNGEAPDIQPPTDLVICPGDSVLLNSGPVLPGAGYVWIANPPDASLSTTQASPIVTPTVNTVYSVSATLGNCTVVQQIEIKADKATLDITSDTLVCAGTPLALQANGSTTGSYTWNTGVKSDTLYVAPDTSTLYTVTFTYGQDCTITDSVLVTVVPSFELTINSFPDTTKLNVGDAVTLFANVNPPADLSKFDFLWQEKTVDTKDLPFNKESIEIVASSNDTSSREITYILYATSPNGCVRRTTIRFELVYPIVRFPNAFTPDGDGTNDVFEMNILQGLAYVSSMEIFNRWGQVVFSSTDKQAAWDGKIDGDDAPADVYAYKVWYRRGDDALQVLQSGAVVLIR